MAIKVTRSPYPWKEGQEKHFLSFRLPKELYLRLEKMSYEEGWAVNALIIFFIEEMFGMLDFEHPSLPSSGR